MKQVTSVKFYDCYFEKLPITYPFYRQLTNLVHLDLSNTGIRLLDPIIYRQRLVWELSKVNLSKNRITHINQHSLIFARNAQEIDLSNNLISEITDDGLQRFPYLSTINLAGNLLSEIEGNLFDSTSKLENVNFRGNLIRYISPYAFYHLKYLTNVDLSSNLLSTLGSNIFRGCLNIHSLFLSNNFLKELDLVVSGNLTTLYAESNLLSSIHVKCLNGNDVRESTTSCQPMEHLRLSYNSLTSLANVSKLINLKELMLSYNSLGAVRTSDFTQLKNLEKLNLRHTNLKRITFKTFSQQRKLKFLDISENGLGHLNLEMFMAYMHDNLEEFYASGNNLTEISGRYRFNAFSSLRKLGLGRNLFNCSYLLQIMTPPNLSSDVVLQVDADEFMSGVEHRSGIECSENGATFVWKKLQISF